LRAVASSAGEAGCGGACAVGGGACAFGVIALGGLTGWLMLARSALGVLVGESGGLFEHVGGA
jgi:hypothetical protein